MFGKLLIQCIIIVFLNDRKIQDGYYAGGHYAKLVDIHAIDCQRDADCQRDVLFFSPFFLVKRNFLDINHSKNIKFGKNMCIGVIFQKITKNGIFSHFSCIYGSAMTLGGRFFSKKNFSTPIIPVFVFFHLNIRN